MAHVGLHASVRHVRADGDGSRVDRFTEVVHTHADRATTFAVLSDPRRVPDWLTIARAVDAVGEIGQGQRLEVTGGHLGVTRTIAAEVTAHEPPSRYAWGVDRPLTMAFTYELVAARDGTEVTATVAADLGGLPRVATRLAVRSLRREFARSLRELADLAARGS